jgi:hypothetical protein
VIRPDLRAVMRSSISSRKLRIRPWIGQAAASPQRADCVPLDLLGDVQQHVDLLDLASPRTSRSITRIIQPVPSGRACTAAALVLVELREPPDRLHHVRALVHDDHGGGAQARPLLA